ncbi:recQ-like DNA helicase BLM [Myxocyprinus asiaticus]|uniref:recQ-like DNA helicase BLM n=1 Tax=Myxocyprinus asiaticus TaxID=70543 RepID=UPI0022231AB3|nr:recQ-like DNA helicase BLM [Myxocyprinus asiaticus]
MQQIHFPGLSTNSRLRVHTLHVLSFIAKQYLTVQCCFFDVFLASLGQRIVDMFHSMTSDSGKKHIIQALTDPRVVFATSALGMGVDLKNVQHVVQYGPPKDIQTYMQAYGRAGRGGSMSHYLILYHGKQLIGISEKMREYVSNDSSCRRTQLLYLFVGEVVQPLAVKHACCDNCAKMCQCKDSYDGNASDLELHAAKSIAHKLRTVSDHQRESLCQMLMDRLEGDVDHGLCGNISVYHTLQEHYSTKDTIMSETLQSCETLFSTDDITCRVHVYDLNQAKTILETIMDVFGDCESDVDSNCADDSVNVSAFDALSLDE